MTIERIHYGQGRWNQAWHVRVEVFVREQGVPPDIELDEYDPLAIHLAAVDKNAVLGTARIIRVDDRTAKIGRVAVLKPHRSAGVGKQLMHAALAHARAAGAREAVLTAQVQVIPFYERLGFIAEGDIFDEAGIPHRTMRLALPDIEKGG